MNSKAWDFAAIVAVLIFLYFVIREVLPHCKEVTVEKDVQGNIKFSAFTHDSEELADAAPPLVLQGS
jgi:hypothetical protein